MLTADQSNYLSKISDAKVLWRPYDPRMRQIADELIAKIHGVLPNAEIKFMGASALGISGQGDIDITVLTAAKNFAGYKDKLKTVLGDNKPGISVIEWDLAGYDYNVTVYLADPNEPSTASQIKVHEILQNDPSLLKEYETLKAKAAGSGLRAYQAAKYEFYNKILGL